MDKELFISICLPVLNGEKTIYQTLKSLLSQNYQNFEIVVSNNSSIDNTIKIINSFNDIRIKLHNTKTLISCGENIINSIKKHNRDKSIIKEIISLVKETGGLEYAIEKMNYFHKIALEDLNKLPDNEFKSSLTEMINYVIQRDF